ncbi:hypothetical protein WKW79_27330 [Variovorax robiniae]|uniref:Lipoprotein transmembrane n=1 Tax=Variovorax robiniae TaxID=1836199 RepID=A0ABU8XEQ4_9BURK
MSMLRRRQGLAAVLVLSLAGVLAGCAGEPTRLPLDSTRAETLQRLGPPTATYALADGGERLQYSRAPAGFEVNNVDLDRSGKVVSITQELDEGLFGNTIQPGVWRVPDVLRTYGRPYEISRVTSFKGDVWSWRYKWHNTIRLLYIYVDPQGLVDHYNLGDDLTLERLTR